MPLNIDFQQIFLHLLNFTILFAALDLLLYRPVKAFMDARAAGYAEKDRQARETLEEAERVELQEMETYSVWWWPEGWQPERYPVAYKFEIEAGYFYSVVFRWGEGWYLEHPFRAIK